MARSRSFPSNLFDLPAFFELGSDTQVILVGLVLSADDYGRGQAHTDWLARKFNKERSKIEQALEDLVARRLIQHYHAEGQDYYVLLQWNEWETLSRPTPSKYPAPLQMSGDDGFQEFPGDFVHPLEIPNNVGEIHSEDEGENEGENEEEDEDEEKAHSKVVPFPTRTDGDGACEKGEITQRVASILKLKVTDALLRIVQEYHTDASLSILGEADAAREWIDDPRRNKQQRRMTPAFFRRWLKREQTAQRRHATGTTGQSGTPPQSAGQPRSTGLSGRSLMNLEAQYQRSHLSDQSKETNPS